MPQPFSKEKKQQWEERLRKQRRSGLSVAGWCRKNKINESVFYYWKRKLDSPPLRRSSFTELSEQEGDSSEAKDAGVHIEYQGFRIRLDKQFDLSTLKQCLVALKGGRC